MTSILYQDEDYEQLSPYIDGWINWYKKLSIFNKEPGIDMMKGTYAFYVEKDIEKQKYFITKRWFVLILANLILKINKKKWKNI